MSGVQLTPEQQKLANDHDLRILVEQNIEIRHCETLSLASIAIAFTAFSLALKYAAFPSTKDFLAIPSYLGRVRLIQDGFIAKYFYPLLLATLGFTSIAIHLQRVTRKSEKRMIAVYQNLFKQMPSDALVSIRELDPATLKIAKSDLRVMPNSLFRLGLGLMILLTSVALVFGLLSIFLEY